VILISVALDSYPAAFHCRADLDHHTNSARPQCKYLQIWSLTDVDGLLEDWIDIEAENDVGELASMRFINYINLNMTITHLGKWGRTLNYNAVGFISNNASEFYPAYPRGLTRRYQMAEVLFIYIPSEQHVCLTMPIFRNKSC
jgi:hypothetical protein